ncbi:MAG: DUF1801 domain-containing protein [Chitinophagales bacterium]|nr:DUF1801 domain-containing protein [Chitinophagales bacterium]
MNKQDTFETVDAYISAQPEVNQALLQTLRETILKAAPEAEELISYQMPAYKLHGVLVYFAGYKNHIGFYPTGSGISTFLPELTAYKTSKGTVQFPLNKKLPIALIRKMVKYRVQENLLKQQRKTKKK